MAVISRSIIVISIGFACLVGRVPAFARSPEVNEAEAASQSALPRSRVATKKPTESSAAISVGPRGHYDEVFRTARDQNGKKIGIVRPEYQDVVDVASQLSESKVRKTEQATQADFRGDNVLSLVPRVVLDTDYDGILKPGIDQRGRALRAFLQDFHANEGKPTIAEAGIIPQERLDSIVARNVERWAVGRVDPNAISVMYGPDIIRDPNGVFRVVEDNTGFLGGFGDLKLALDSLYRNVPYPELHERDPMDFYRTLLERYRERASPAGGEIVMLMIPPYADNEDPRLGRILKSLGIEVITPFTKSKLEFDDHNKAWLIPAGSSKRKQVGFILLNGEHWWLDMRHEELNKVAIYEYSKLVLEELENIRQTLEREELSAKDRLKSKTASKSRRNVERDLEGLRRIQREYGLGDMTRKQAGRLLNRFMRVLGDRDKLTGLPNTEKLKVALAELNQLQELKEWEYRSYHGLAEAVLTGRVASNYTPGTNFVNDKEFYIYVEDIVRYYLKEEPILRNIETIDPRVMRAGLPAEFDRELAKSIRNNQADWVIKVVDGRGGKGIWVGAKVSGEEFRRGLKAVQGEPGRYKYQRYTALSAISKSIVDIRIHSDLPPSGSLFVSDTAWGRGLPVEGDGKVNLSAQGRETTVVVRSAQKFCESLFVPSVLPSSMVYRRK
ncbi:MAG: circularly permuted type 2 ATP-grasp protein [Deltaproteobacteria bacterium]|nr:circularly permuted type 2 ATP-grasp protein [Deltaproteobacteria bacterium]